MGTLYKLDFASSKSYVGITTWPIVVRFNGHASAALHGSKCAVHNAWRKHGVPKLTVLAVVEDRILSEIEQRAISVFGTLSPKGYNLTSGGEFFTMAPMARKKISRARTGMKFTKEHCANISRVRKGRKQSKVSNAKRSVTMKARRMVRSKKEREYLSNFWKDNPDHPMKRPEIAAKMAASRLGRKQSAETIKRRSVSMRLAWSNPKLRAQQSRRSRKAWANPELRAQHSILMKKVFSNSMGSAP